MTTIAIPSALAETLRKTVGPARLVDEQGKVVGEFAPARRAGDELTPEQMAGLGADIRKRILAGRLYTGSQYVRAQRVRALARHQLQVAMAGLDALALPTVADKVLVVVEWGQTPIPAAPVSRRSRYICTPRLML